MKKYQGLLLSLAVGNSLQKEQRFLDSKKLWLNLVMILIMFPVLALIRSTCIQFLLLEATTIFSTLIKINGKYN